MNDITKLQNWFDDYLVSEQPDRVGGGYIEDVNHKEGDDKPKGQIYKPIVNCSISELICSQAEITKADISRYSTAFRKIIELKTKDLHRANKHIVLRSGPFQQSIQTLTELETKATSIRKHDPEYGEFVPETSLKDYVR